MRLEIKGLAEIASQALAEEAERLAQTIRDRLSELQGADTHDTPWLRTGTLRDSIASTVDGLEAAIGSNDPAAAPQEQGTVHLPPRPFLAPAAAAAGADIAQSIAKKIAAALKHEQP